MTRGVSNDPKMYGDRPVKMRGMKHWRILIRNAEAELRALLHTKHGDDKSCLSPTGTPSWYRRWHPRLGQAAIDEIYYRIGDEDA